LCSPLPLLQAISARLDSYGPERLGAYVPVQNLTSVVAVYCLVASWLCRTARLDPAGEGGLTRRSSCGPALIPYVPTRASKTLRVALGFRSKSVGPQILPSKTGSLQAQPLRLAADGRVL
jgi:hypothetical protein